MESKKSKIFTKKLIALFLAVVMALSCFTGVLSVYATSNDDYHDSNLAANFLAWAETTDEQTAEALLDYADLYLPSLIKGINNGSTYLSFSYDIPVIGTLGVSGDVGSINGVLEIVRQAYNLTQRNLLGIKYLDIIGGDVKNVDLSMIKDINSGLAENYDYRGNNDAKDIIMVIAKFLYKHSNDAIGKNIIRNFIDGTFDLGLVGSFVDLYQVLGDALGLDTGYQNDLVYNIVQTLIWDNTDWYTEDEVNAFKTGAAEWNFDTELFKKLNTELIQEINVNITYTNEVTKIGLDPADEETYGQLVDEEGKLLEDGEDPITVKDSSQRRWYFINKKMTEDEVSYKEAARALGYDPNLVYSMNNDGTSDGNIRIFVYNESTDGDDVTYEKALNVQVDENLSTVAFHALEIAWTTAIEPTVGLIQVNYNGNETSGLINGTNFDNKFYDWMSDNRSWNTENWRANYSEENVQAWAEDTYQYFTDTTTGEPLTSAEQFLDGVKASYNYDRTAKDDASWRTIGASKLFNELRYSPLADVYFDVQTGPINLYFAQTGADNLSDFFASAFTEYNSIVQGLNNGLIAAVDDLFPQSDNIGIYNKATGEVDSLTLPALTKISTTDSSTVASTLVSNALKVFEYAANAADENIFAQFYANHTNLDKMTSSNLTEGTFEEACVPLLIAALQEVDMVKPIHAEDWDTAKDAEGVAILALEEYLSYVLPDKDYSELWQVTDGRIVAGTHDIDGSGNITLFEDAIMPMARDALGYILQSFVPCRDETGREWSVYTSNPYTDDTSIFDILNQIACYYASDDNFDNTNGIGSVKGKAAAALIGVVRDGDCKVKTSQTLWENIDVIANTILPLLGQLQKNVKGGFDSYDLFYNKIIRGVLDIGANGGGITNIIEQVVDIINSDFISGEGYMNGVDVVVYDTVADVLNGIFGSKFSSSSWQKVVPNASEYDSDYTYDKENNRYSSTLNTATSSATPFDSLVQKNTIAYYSDGTGILGTLLGNLYESLGGQGYDGDARWSGVMFAVKAVNNFIPSFVPQLSEMQFKPLTAEVTNPSLSGLSSGTNIASDATALIITNNSMGLNRFYRPSATGQVERDGRYFVKVKGITTTTAAGAAQNEVTVSVPTGANSVIAPESSYQTSISARPVAGTTAYRIAVTYNIFEGEMNGSTKPSAPSNDSDYFFENDLTAYAYLVLSTEKSWMATVYPASADPASTRQSDGIWWFPTNLEYANTSGAATYEYTSTTARGGTASWGSNTTQALYPNALIVSTSDTDAASHYGYRWKSFSGDRGMDGIFAYLASGTTYTPVNGGIIQENTVTATADDKTVGYALCDVDGNIINNEFYDYRVYDETNEEWGAWNREGKSASDIETLQNGTYQEQFVKGYFETRPHVVKTLEESLAIGSGNGKVVGVIRELAGYDENNEPQYKYESMLVTVTNYEPLAGNSPTAYSWATPVPGIIFNSHGTKATGGGTIYDKLIAYDGSTELKSTKNQPNGYVTFKVNFFTSNNNDCLGTIRLYVADDSEKVPLKTRYDEALTQLSAYTPEDFKDYDSETKISADYNAMVQTLTNALTLYSTPINEGNAATITSTFIARGATAKTDRFYGDPAFAPIPTSRAIPSSIVEGATQGADGYWYYNEECTMPVYSNTALTDATVSNKTTQTIGEETYQVGEDATGAAVVKVSGTWYLLNDTSYKYEWDDSTYTDTVNGTTVAFPYYAKTNEAETDGNGNTVYLRTQFVYRDAEGEKVSSTTMKGGELAWRYKLAETETVVKENTGSTDNRGIFKKSEDAINYMIGTLSEKVNTAGAYSIANGVTAVRSVDSNNVNYDVASYERMVEVANAAEDLIWYVDENGDACDKDKEGAIPVTDRSATEINAAVKIFNRYFGTSDNNYLDGRVIRRGYIGGRLETEIAHHISDSASASEAYSKFVVEEDDERGEYRFAYSTKSGDEVDDVQAYTVTAPTLAGQTLTFCTVDAEGNLVNADDQGNKLWTDESWQAYLDALGEAVTVAQYGNDVKGTDDEFSSESIAKVSNTYTAKSHLVITENNLEEYVEPVTPEGIAVSGRITMATNASGTTGDTGIDGISILVGGVEYGVSGANGAFDVTLPDGTTQFVLHRDGATTDRTVSIAQGATEITNAVIPVVVCDYDNSGKIDNRDKTAFNMYYFNGDNYNKYCDFDGSGAVDNRDKTTFNMFYFYGGDGTISYSALTLE